MIVFEPQDEIRVYVGVTGSICISAESKDPEIGGRVVALTIGQFRTIMSKAEDLILEADKAKKSRQKVGA